MADEALTATNRTLHQPQSGASTRASDSAPTASASSPAPARSGILPGAGFWQGQDAWNQILGAAPRILLASFCAYLVGEFLNSYVLAKMKIATNGKHLWTRTIGSTVVGQLADTAIFMTIAFGGILPLGVMLNAAGTEWVSKVGYEVLATPFTYLVVAWLKRVEGVDFYDRNTRFNPVLLTD